uniref:IPT/TIG domain-containing protein n=1 Tax=Petromyzon marinus TaxID=7757 RepID=S4RFT2_PETMA
FVAQNPDIVLVHYLNVPAIEDCGKPCGPILCSINTDRKEWAKWSREELVGQLKPMFHGIKWTCGNGNGASEFSVEQLVQQIMDSHQAKPQPRTHTCLCNGRLGAAGSTPHKCNSTKHRIISPKVEAKGGGGAAAQAALTEVQNISSASSSTSSSTSSSCETKCETEPSSCSPGQVVSSSTSESQVEIPDTTQNSPLGSANNFFGDADGLAMAAVTCSLPQNAVIFMTGIAGGKPVPISTALSGGQQFMSLAASAGGQGLGLTVNQELSLESVRPNLALPPTANHELSGLAAGSSSELSGDSGGGGGASIISAPSTFDPDAFLNSPKQGQTYGGGLNKDSINPGYASPGAAEAVFSPATGLIHSLKTEVKGMDHQVDEEYGDNQLLINSESTNQIIKGTLISSGCLSPSTTLENMDFSSLYTHKPYSAITYTHLPASPPSSLQKPASPLAQTQVLKTESPTQFSAVCAGVNGNGPSVSGGVSVPSPSVKSDPSSPVRLYQYQPELQAMPQQDVETAMDTSVSVSVHSSTGDIAMAPKVPSDAGRQFSEPKVSSSSNGGTGLAALQAGNAGDLYNMVQSDMGGASNMEINLEQFDLTFDSQFPDLMADFMATDSGGGGSRSLYGLQERLIEGSSNGGGGTVSTFTSHVPMNCTQPQQQQPQQQSQQQAQNGLPGLQLSTAGSSVSFVGMAGVESPQGMLVTVTDFSPEWSYPEGGVKVLITGPWNVSSDSYSCLFDQISVPATLIQSGVLRCYCPGETITLV